MTNRISYSIEWCTTVCYVPASLRLTLPILYLVPKCSTLFSPLFCPILVQVMFGAGFPDASQTSSRLPPSITDWSLLTLMNLAGAVKGYRLLLLLLLHYCCWVTCKRTQQCWPTTPNIVGSCCVRLHIAKSFTGFKLGVTTPKNTQHATGCANRRNM